MLEFLNTIAPFVQMASGVMGQRATSKAAARGNAPTAAEIQYNNIVQELMNPDSPLLKRLSEKDRQSAIDAFQGQIRTMQTADRRNVALGRQPTFFNPERADEAVSFLTSRAMGPMGAGADELARNRLVQASTGYQNLMPTQQARLNSQTDEAKRLAAYRSEVPNQIIDVLRGMVSQRSLTNPQSRDMGPINWNQQLPSIYRG